MKTKNTLFRSFFQLTGLLAALVLVCVNPSFAQQIKSKDGKNIGSRKLVMRGCVKAARAKNLEIAGMKIDAESYCSCVCDKVLPAFTLKEIEAAETEEDMTKLLFGNKSVELIYECVSKHVAYADSFELKAADTSIVSKDAMKKVCEIELKKNLKADTSMSWINPTQLCNCVIEKMLNKGVTYEEFNQLEDENSPIFNEVLVPCIVEMKQLADSTVALNTNTSDVEGINNTERIPLIDYIGQGYKIKLVFGNTSKYFLFDTGAGDIGIDRATEKEFVAKGILGHETYADTVEYQLADNRIVKCHMRKLSNIGIGNYKVNNVDVAVLKEGMLLCGRSFLDKFEKWEIDKKKKELVLYK